MSTRRPLLHDLGTRDRSTKIGLLVLLLCVCAHSRTNGQTLSIESLKKDLPQRNDKLRRALENYRGIGVVTDSSNFDRLPEKTKETLRAAGKPVPSGIQVLAKKKLSFSVSGTNRKVVIDYLQSDPTELANKTDQRKPLRKTELRLGPTNSSWLEWRGDASEPKIKSISKDGATEKLLLGNEFESLLKSIYSLPFGTLSELLANPDFKVTGLKEVPSKQHTYTQMDFEFSKIPATIIPTKKKQTDKLRLVGSVTLDPAHDYAIQSYSYADAANPSRQEYCLIEYDESKTDRVIPIQIAQEAHQTRTRVLKLEEFVLEAVEPSQFTLAIPGREPVETTPEELESSAANWAWWIVGLGLVLVGLGSWIWLRKRK